MVAGVPMMNGSALLALRAALSRSPRRQQCGSPRVTFDIVLPAHDEEHEIASTVGSLLAVDYPRDLFRVLVVADNCHDRTADRAAAAGARVLVRTDADRRGKGYALSYAFESSLRDGFADALVVVDADTTVTPNLLAAFAERFAAGASAVQAEYAVRNPRSSWRTRIMTIAFASFHGVRSLARERLGVSCGLRGNGMGFSSRLLRDVPHAATSIVEDVEYGIELGYAGIRVEFVADAKVFGQMVTGERASRSQRARWEEGRRGLVRQHALGLLTAAWRRRDPVLLDLALDLIVPPLAELVVVIAGGLLISLLLGWSPAVWIWGAAAAAVVAYVLRGWHLSGVGPRGLVDLLCAPFYVAWKIAMRLNRRSQRSKTWVRTTREVEL